MALKLSVFLASLALSGLIEVKAQDFDSENKFLTIKEMTVTEITTDDFNQERRTVVDHKQMNIPGAPNKFGFIEPTENIGRIILAAQDLVAFGESLYHLVIKGKPTNTTSHAPISVIPMVDKRPVDIQDLENWTPPTKRTYQVSFKNLYRIEVVSFKYSIVYSWNGSYNGSGSYLTAVQIIPEAVKTLIAFDFTATMKLAGIHNQGTRANPIAAAIITLEYNAKSMLMNKTQSWGYVVTGRGGFKAL